MPLLNIIFPANVLYFVSFLINIVNFEIFPTQKIISVLFKFTNELDISNNSTHSDSS